MKSKLKKFTEFSQDMLPHELDYLLEVQQFQDADNLAILRHMRDNCDRLEHPQPFDTRIDKRKYSNLKTWIQNRLEAIDVDEQYERFSALDRKVITDSITPAEEKQILAAVRKYDKPYFYFTKFYELLENYRHFLLIRLRYDEHKVVNAFLKKHKAAYQRSRKVFSTLHTATEDIIEQHAAQSRDPRKWETWLTEVFYDEKLDGHNRYLALVRLTFMYVNYREFEKLAPMYDYLDDMFRRGENYSRRLVANYYANRLIYHAKFDELEDAEWYGRLSVRYRNTEYLYYVTNLSAILLRRGKSEASLHLMKEAFPHLKHTPNYHHKTGFVAFYLRSLNECGQCANAERYAETFIRSYKDHLFAQRWHIFFTAYLQSLLLQEKYSKLLRVARKYGLLKREAEYQKRALYLPTITWYHAVAQYKETELNLTELEQLLVDSSQAMKEDAHKLRLVIDLADELKPHIPGVFGWLKSGLEEEEAKALTKS
jgi:hypothetical protein